MDVRSLRYKKLPCSRRPIIVFGSAVVIFTFVMWMVFGGNLSLQMIVDTIENLDGATLKRVSQLGNSSELVVIRPKKRYANGQARDVAFIVDSNTRPSGKTDSLKPKIIYFATLFHGQKYFNHHYCPQPGRKSFQNYDCPYSNCIVTRDARDLPKADAVLFHLRDIKIWDLPDFRSPSQKWIIYTTEPPWLELSDLGRFDGFFNWTMSYRLDSDIVVKYGFVAKRNENTEVKGTPILMSSKPYMAVWFVSDCCTQSHREEYVMELRKHIQVDVFGSCGKSPCLPAESKACYDNLLPKYRFYLSFENALCKDYVTEKFFNALDQDVIPVVFGGANYASLAPPGSYINAMNFAKPRELAEYLKYIAGNETLYSSYFKWKSKYKVFLHAWSCDLCAKLNQDFDTATVRTQLRHWWDDEATCRTWTKNGFTRNLTPTLPCYRRKIFD